MLTAWIGLPPGRLLLVDTPRRPSSGITVLKRQTGKPPHPLDYDVGPASVADKDCRP
jgi:hypothetical protein